MSDWTECEFITDKSDEVEPARAERTGWEMVRFEIADEEPDSPEI
ncbi:MAG: hypothetical protein ACXV5L_00100 [Thermoanaerobaculia bacterium]